MNTVEGRQVTGKPNSNLSSNGTCQNRTFRDVMQSAQEIGGNHFKNGNGAKLEPESIIKARKGDLLKERLLKTIADPATGDMELKAALRELRKCVSEGLVPAKELEQPMLSFLAEMKGRDPKMKLEVLEIFLGARTSGRYSQDEVAEFIVAALEKGLLNEHMRVSILRLGQTGSRTALEHLMELVEGCELCSGSASVYIFQALEDLAAINPELRDEVTDFSGAIKDDPGKSEKIRKLAAGMFGYLGGAAEGEK